MMLWRWREPEPKRVKTHLIVISASTPLAVKQLEYLIGIPVTKFMRIVSMPALFKTTTFATAIAALATISVTSSFSLAEDATVVELTQTA